jgi:hypothetical protein
LIRFNKDNTGHKCPVPHKAKKQMFLFFVSHGYDDINHIRKRGVLMGLSNNTLNRQEKQASFFL